MSRGRWGLTALLATGAVLAYGTTDGPAGAATLPTAHSAPVAASRSSSPAHSSNLLHGDAATFEKTSGGWSSPTATAVVQHSTSHRGAGALAVTPRLRATQAPARVLSKPLKARGGDLFTARFWLTGSTARSGVKATLIFTSDSGQVIATVSGATVLPGSTWVRSPAVTAMAPRKTKTVQAVITMLKPLITNKLYVDDASLIRMPAPPVSTFRRLKVVGPHIVNGAGHVVRLKGINRAGLETQSDHAVSLRDAEAFKRWGINLVRVPLNPNFWLHSGCAYDPSYRGRVDRVVKLLTARHMVALLDLHTVTPCGSSGNYPMADSALALPFWHQVAKRYRKNPLAAFDPWNEPHNISRSVWLNGGTVSWGSGTFQAAGMQQMYDVIRRAGAKDNLVFISGNHWASAPGGRYLHGHGIVYAAHAYTCPHEPPPNCSYKGDVYDPTPYMDRWVSVAKHHPVVVTEFGWPNRGDEGRYISKMLSIVRHRGWGWAVWGYNGTTIGKFDVVGLKLKEHTYEPSPVGMPALRDLARRH
jgi:aryl-phospho-beta-D-glucosidase BglC (GH1 family)